MYGVLRGVEVEGREAHKETCVKKVATTIQKPAWLFAVGKREKALFCFSFHGGGGLVFRKAQHDPYMEQLGRIGVPEAVGDYTLLRGEGQQGKGREKKVGCGLTQKEDKLFYMNRGPRPPTCVFFQFFPECSSAHTTNLHTTTASSTPVYARDVQHHHHTRRGTDI